MKKIVSKILRIEATLVLKKYKPKIIVVTGSVGKTSTKDLIYTVISKHVSSRKSQKSFNSSDIGVPLTILGCNNAWGNPFLWVKNIYEGLALYLFKSEYPEWLVLEVGADRPGEIKDIMKWVIPDIAVLTKLPDVPVHVEFFDSPEEVYQEKLSVLHALKSDGVAILNADDKRIAESKNILSPENEVIFYGLGTGSPITVKKMWIQNNKNGKPIGLEFALSVGNIDYPVAIAGTIGKGIVYSALAAFAVGIALRMKPEEITKRLTKHISPPGRLRILEGIHGCTIIDDTYNSSPDAVINALEALDEIQTSGRKIAVLADMKELGKHTVEEHQKIGEKVVSTADQLYAVGPRAIYFAEGARTGKEKLLKKNTYYFDDSTSCGKALERRIKSDDVILVKGSQSMRMEKVVKMILKEAIDAKYLVRQEKEWEKR